MKQQILVSSHPRLPSPNWFSILPTGTIIPKHRSHPDSTWHPASLPDEDRKPQHGSYFPPSLCSRHTAASPPSTSSRAPASSHQGLCPGWPHTSSSLDTTRSQPAPPRAGQIHHVPITGSKGPRPPLCPRTTATVLHLGAGIFQESLSSGT